MTLDGAGCSKAYYGLMTPLRTTVDTTSAPFAVASCIRWNCQPARTRLPGVSRPKLKGIIPEAHLNNHTPQVHHFCLTLYRYGLSVGCRSNMSAYGFLPSVVV